MFKNTATTSTLTIIFILNHFYGYCTPDLYDGDACQLKDGSLGVCKSLVLCRWVNEGLRRGSIKTSDLVRCSFEGTNEITCCKDEIPTPSQRPIPSGDEDIYFGDGKSFNKKHSPAITTSDQIIFTYPINNKIENPDTTSKKSVKITSTRSPPFTTITTTRSPPFTIFITRSPPFTTISTTRSPPLTTFTTTRAPWLATTTTQRSPRVIPSTLTRLPSAAITRLPSAATTRLPVLSTTTRQTNQNASKSPVQPTVHPFWSTWSPINDVNVEVFNDSTTSATTQKSNALIMPPFVRDILAAAIDRNNTVGDGCNNIDSETICGSNNDISIIPNPTSPSSTSPPPPRLGQRRSEIACENYTRLSSAFLSFNILGGSPTALGEFPHMAALGFPTQEFGGNEYDFNCGGSVISENFILTAAHCVTDRNLPTIVRTGKITLLTNDDGVEGVTSTIAEIISHPNYTPSRRYDDIALIRLANPIPFDDHIRPACLRSNMSDIGADVQLIVTGWGRTSVEFGQRSNALLKTNLTGVSLASCNSSLLDYNANDRSLRNGVNLGQICANDPQGGHDSCEGDSGGPLQIYSENGMSTIVGVTSFGISCGSALPSVYARVAFYLDWIESIVWPSR